MLYKFRDRLRRGLTDVISNGIFNTRPFNASTPENASTEVHTLLSCQDFALGLVALKSLLRFRSDLSIVITSDGTLSDRQKETLAKHIKNISIMERFELLQSKSRLESLPELQMLYKSEFNLSAKLLHPLLLGRTDKIIVLDSDTIFLRNPVQIQNWLDSANDYGLYIHDSPMRNKETPWLSEMYAEALKDDSIRTSMKLENHFFNSGLLCYAKSQCNLEIAEKFLRWRKASGAQYRNEPYYDVFLGDWIPEQTAYACLFETMSCPIHGLGSEYKIGTSEGGTFNHFLRSGTAKPAARKMIKQTINALLDG